MYISDLSNRLALTPALSPRRGRIVSRSVAIRGARFVYARAMILPLPGGEGRGEGERGGQSSLFSPIQTRKKCRTDPDARRYFFASFRAWANGHTYAILLTA